MYQKRKMTSTL
jgi:hypothetical protein